MEKCISSVQFSPGKWHTCCFKQLLLQLHEILQEMISVKGFCSVHCFCGCFKPVTEFILKWKMETAEQSQDFTNLPLLGLPESHAIDLIRSVTSWLISGPPSLAYNNISTLQVWVPRHYLHRIYITDTGVRGARGMKWHCRGVMVTQEDQRGHLLTRLDCLGYCCLLASSCLVLRMLVNDS